MADNEFHTALEDDWLSVRLVFDDADDACKASHANVQRYDPDATDRLTRFLVYFAGRKLTELELCIERPPRFGLYEDDPGLLVVFEGQVPELNGPARTYRIKCAGRTSVVIAVGMGRSSILRFECHE